MKFSYSLIIFIVILSFEVQGQQAKDFYSIIDNVSEERIEKDIRALANFGTRHTLSDTLSEDRGIGAARR